MNRRAQHRNEFYLHVLVLNVKRYNGVGSVCGVIPTATDNVVTTSNDAVKLECSIVIAGDFPVLICTIPIFCRQQEYNAYIRLPQMDAIDYPSANSDEC